MFLSAGFVGQTMTGMISLEFERQYEGRNCVQGRMLFIVGLSIGLGPLVREGKYNTMIHEKTCFYLMAALFLSSVIDIVHQILPRIDLSAVPVT